MNPSQLKPLAVVTGASAGIGYELAKQFGTNGFDLLVAAEEQGKLGEAVQAFKQLGDLQVESVAADLSTPEGVEQLYAKIKELGRPVDALAANAGRGLGKSFFDQDLDEAIKVVNTNIVGTIHLIHLVGRDMRERGQGRILITSSVAAFIPGTFQAVYNGTKAFLQLFSFAIRNELKDSGVSVTALLPGATDTDFFDTAGLKDTQVGTDPNKDDPADVAKTGFEGLMKGEGDVVHGLKNQAQVAAARVAPQTQLAEMHRGMAEPGSADKNN